MPSLDSTLPSYEEGGSELELIASLINTSSDYIFTENDVRSDKCDWRAPSESDSSRSARLFLSHLGLLRLGIQEVIHYHLEMLEPELRINAQFQNDYADTMFVGLDSSANVFSRELDDLDLSGPRSHDTVFVFYVKSGQKLTSEILSNTVKITLLILKYSPLIYFHCSWHPLRTLDFQNSFGRSDGPLTHKTALLVSHDRFSYIKLPLLTVQTNRFFNLLCVKVITIRGFLMYQ